MTGLSPAMVASLRERLAEERERLAAEQEGSETWRRPVELDQQSVGRLSRMDAMQQQAMADAEARRRRSDIARIDAALKRIADDEYGWCVTCGEPIAPRRLEVDPAAPRCVGCASAR